MAQQIVFKLPHPPSELAANAPSIAPAVLSAMQRLVELVAQLRSNDEATSDEATSNEATSHSPYTPETLSLYVLEEAQDVLEALYQANQNRQWLEPVDRSVPSAWQGYFWLHPLASWLLWVTARSSYEVMRLMEGCVVNGLRSDQTWQPHILRLVPLLSLHLPKAVHAETRYTIDLTTDRAFLGERSADRIIQFDTTQFPFPSTLPQSPIATTDLMAILVQQIQTATPAIVPFLQGISADCLIPCHFWQTGSLQLHYQFEVHELDLQTPLPDSLCTASLPIPQIKFTDSTWLKQYQSLIVRQQLGRLLDWTSLPNATEPVATDESSSALSALVADACQVADRLQQGWDVATRQVVTRSLNCSELAARLHWCLIHSAYEVMQLVSGIPVTLLCPQSSCQTGILRFLIGLKIQTCNSEWILDLATGQTYETNRSPLPANAIVQSEANQWCAQPNTLAHLETTLWHQVDRFIPELNLLLQGAEIDLWDQTQQWQPGTIQLQGHFEFIG